MIRIRKNVLAFLMVFLLATCQDPIFWTQQSEGLTQSNNLVKNARVFDVDFDSNSYLYVIVGGFLYRRHISNNEWVGYDLPQKAHSLDVDRGKISLTVGIYEYDFVNMQLGPVIDINAKRAFFDKRIDGTVIEVRYARSEETDNPMDLFFVDNTQYVGRYIGMIRGMIVSSIGVFDPNVNAPINRDRFRDPTGTDGTWLLANNLAGIVKDDVSDFIFTTTNTISGVAVISYTDAFNTDTQDGTPDTVALVSVGGIVNGGSGYREIFLDKDEYRSRSPLSSVNDIDKYLSSDLSSAYIERFFYKRGMLFALTTNRGLWTQYEKSGSWIWE